MKAKRNWREEAAWYQRLMAALVIKGGGEVTLTEEDIRFAVEKGIEVAQIDGGVLMRPKADTQSRIITIH